MDYLRELNSAQKKAVLQKDGPLLILAGAGAGKTKTITYRILHLIKESVPPASILAITFTNKAAKEMRDRVETLLSNEKTLNRPLTLTERPFISTFHSLGAMILRENASLVGISKHFSILDKSDSLKLIKEALKEEGIDPKSFEPGSFQSLISKEKSNAVTLEDYQEKIGNDYVPKMVAAVWERYETKLQKEKALDFDDLLLKTALVLKKHPEVREKYQRRWRYFHIDEYQDTNKVQYMIAKLLGAESKNICVVGDLDQTIYSWRGADIGNLLHFEKDYPETTIVVLEENYRSTQTILTVANRIIEKNKLRKEKRLFTKNGDGDKISVYAAYDENDEARFVASKSKELIDKGFAPKEIAVLYRANFESRALEEAFLSLNIPYQVLGVRFFERKEIKDITAYLRAALNPEGLSDLKRIINVPPRGIGKLTILKLFAGRENDLPETARKKIAAFRKILEGVKNAALKEKPSQIIKFILKTSGMEEELKKGGGEDAERLENIRELVTFATRYDIYEKSEEGVEHLLADAALASDQDELMKEKNAVRLMTVHASKGLEFDIVFVTGLEEDLFPHKKIGEAGVSDNEAEEERRLFYVALTRARKKIYLSYAGTRTIFGSKQVNLPSEFILDIDDEFLEKEESFSGGGKIIYLD